MGSWTRTVAVALLILALFLGLFWLGSTGRLADLRYASIPLVRPWPPTGYYINPLNPSHDRGDLVNAAGASRVKADLLEDGQIELQALERGDASLLAQSDTGNSLVTIRQLLQANASQGQVMRFDNHLSSVVVGRLADPNDPAVMWCVEEKGTSTITYLDKASGRVVRQQAVTFDDRFWMVKVGGRYLITDVEVKSQPNPGA